MSGKDKYYIVYTDEDKCWGTTKDIAIANHFMQVLLNRGLNANYVYVEV